MEGVTEDGHTYYYNTQTGGKESSSVSEQRVFRAAFYFANSCVLKPLLSSIFLSCCLS